LRLEGGFGSGKKEKGVTSLGERKNPSMIFPNQERKGQNRENIGREVSFRGLQRNPAATAGGVKGMGVIRGGKKPVMDRGETGSVC